MEIRKELESRLNDPNIWNDREEAQKVTREIKKIKSVVEPWIEMKKEVDDLVELYELAKEEEEEELEKEIKEQLDFLKKKFDKLEKLSLFTDENDASNAYLTIHSGAGGTEACDWVSMLLRMYLRWAEKNGYKTEIVDILPGEEAGIKSVTVYVKGSYAYGYLKTEIGIHRLVRISPFDSNARRHTSFASVYCTPEVDDDIVIDINPKDIKIDTYRSQGAGGQHVNKTDSAVRITHIPTGIVAQCQNERSQHKNKEMAMKILKSKLYEHYKKEKDKERQEEEKNKKDISWGNQIRSYVFQPYTLVKDLRTGVEVGNGNAVLDGEIDVFIEAALKKAV
ncbi:MAG: peptide chain release factor 2 [Spirochaetes bacterium]|nr:MAG: peptide chain release factor 2 [Spirochaetota bacterium]RKY03116.1 MAG: peptide chain release factor 2 [Spirochaetota bacterium]